MRLCLEILKRFLLFCYKDFEETNKDYNVEGMNKQQAIKKLNEK